MITGDVGNSGISIRGRQLDKVCNDPNIKVGGDASIEVADPVKKPPAAALATADKNEGECPGRPSASDSTVQSSAALSASKAETIYNSKVAFPLNLTRMLEAAEGMGKSHIVHWSEDGKSFIICDLDLFLKEVLPKFFKSSENTKIRSFYRKLNRWGFSMARNMGNNPSNVWSHPSFYRDCALSALDEALATGKAVDFLNMSRIAKGRKRRETDNFSKEGANSHEEDNKNIQNIFSDGGIASSQVLPSPSVSRSPSQGSWAGGNLAALASMPILPSALKCSMANKNERKKLSNSYSSPLTQHQAQHQAQQRRLLRHGFAGSAPTLNMPGQEFGNATFDLVAASPGRRSNAIFDLMAFQPTMSASESNTQIGQESSTTAFDNIISSSQGGSSSYTTFNGNFAPRSNMFALSAQDIFSDALTSTSRGMDESSSLYAKERSYPHTRRTVIRPLTQADKLTSGENDELVSFLDSFAETLTEEQVEMCDGEPDPFSPTS